MQAAVDRPMFCRCYYHVTVWGLDSERKCISDDAVLDSGCAVASVGAVDCSCKSVDTFPPWPSRFPYSEARGAG